MAQDVSLLQYGFLQVRATAWDEVSNLNAMCTCKAAAYNRFCTPARSFVKLTPLQRVICHEGSLVTQGLGRGSHRGQSREFLGLAWDTPVKFLQLHHTSPANTTKPTETMASAMSSQQVASVCNMPALTAVQ